MNEAVFTYAGHTFKFAISLNEVYATESEPLGLTFETQSISSVELFEDGKPLGTYPKHFAELETADIITNEIISLKDTGATVEQFTTVLRQTVDKLIANGTFGGVN